MTKRMLHLVPIVFLLVQPLPARSAEKSRVHAVGAFFALSVPDIQASAQWYSEKLGMKTVMQPPKEGKAAVRVLEGEGFMVELIQHDDAQSLTQAAPKLENNILVHGVFKVGLIVDDLEKIIAMLKEREVPIVIGPFPASKGQRANLVIRDNAGNLIQFIAK